MSCTHAKNQGQRSISSKGRVETGGQMDIKTETRTVLVSNSQLTENHKLDNSTTTCPVPGVPADIGANTACEACCD